MDAAEQIKKFQEFLESEHHSDLLKAIRTGKKSLNIDFIGLSKFDIDLAESVLEFPDDSIKAAEIAAEGLEGKNVFVRFFNIPNSQQIMIRNIRSEHINKFLEINGIVRQKSDVRPQVTSAKFECPSCGNTINVLQLDTSFKEPSRCGCGRKGKFRLLNKELVDAQAIILEESPEDIEGSEQPKRMNLFLKNDLVSPLGEKKTNPGSKIKVSGVVKEVPITLRTGAQSTRFDLLIECNHVEGVEEEFGNIEISDEEEKQILDLAKDPKLHDKLIKCVAPTIYGHEKIKEALIYQQVGGVQKERTDGVVTRGDIHVLLVGDPGCGKSQLIKRMQKVAPKARFVSGKGASGAGLTAAVVRDEFLKGWALEAGALVLANKGMCMIDELDKMSNEDRSAMHEALEQQTVSISKANVQATLRSETTVLAAANPKFGRFDPYGIIADQIDLPPALINRFDLIFPIKDLPSAEKDSKLAGFILKLHQNPELNVELDTELIRKYFAYAKQKIHPRINDSALEELQSYFVRMRSGSSSEDGGVKAMPISARQLEALVRLTEAAARLRLSSVATKKDAKKAIELLEYCLAQVATDSETGQIDIDRISTGISATQRNSIHVVKELINELENKLGKVIPIDDIIREAGSKSVSEDTVEEVIEKLKRSGDIFEPKRGFISRI